MARGLWLVTNPFVKYDSWGSIKAMVVSAETEEDARKMRPFFREYPQETAGESEWPGAPEDYEVKYLGPSVVEVGMILCEPIGS